MKAEQQIRQFLRRRARNGRIPCRQLLELAERTGAPPRKIGRLCDQLGIRISNCRLGCFR
ncbi:MAG: hypothetical protein ACYTF6_04605 [Planctomycetota bacterium]|jgi:hypothetical protein